MKQREIKFRAFDPRINTMYLHVKLTWNGGIEARLNSNNCHTVKDITISHANGDHHDYDGEIIVMQFIGRKDKNEKEIFEGDLVKFANDGLWEVVYNAPSFELINIKTKGKVILLGSLIEVVGNKFEKGKELQDDRGDDSGKYENGN